MMKGKAKVLTSTRARESGAVDPKVQLSADEFKEVRRHRAVRESRCEQGENSKSSTNNWPCITSQMLLNKYQHQREEEEYRRQCEEERYEREQVESHWQCPFFRYCWNEGLRLPNRDNCPECSNQHREYWQPQVIHRSIHDRIVYQSDGQDRWIQDETRPTVHDRLKKHMPSHDWPDYEEEDDNQDEN